PAGGKSPRRQTVVAHLGVPAIQSSVVIPLPKLVGGITKDPKLAPIMKMAAAFIPPQEVEQIRKDLEQNLGEGTQELLRTVKERVLAEAEKKARLAAEEKAEKQTAPLALKQEFGCPLKRNGQTVGHLTAKVSADRLLREVLSQTRREQGEIPFAIDASGALFTPDSADEAKLRGLERAAVSGRADALRKETPGDADADLEPKYGKIEGMAPA